jgi:hypothetical protein
MDAEEVLAIRTSAASYAKQFLARKYREEYIELYSAYCKNRGLTTRANRKPMVDERELVSE